MELQKLSLKNFRTHRKLELNFQNGITGIVGDNGTGKSSVVEAIIFLFTGDGYGSKSEMLSVGEESGYVLGTLKIDGKEAVLERHLDSSKVVFKYDGITYKKAGEVSEIWEKLFQIDKNIFKNIVVAKQGDIALLFSGDNSTKEKIFQKIFLVPNTTKIRDTIWGKYIKTAPPEYPLVDEAKINDEIEGIQNQIVKLEENLAGMPEDLSTDYAQLLSRKNYLDGCKSSMTQRDVISQQISMNDKRKEEISSEIAKIDSKLGSVDISQITQDLEKLKANKPLYDKKKQLTEQLQKLLTEEPAKFPEESEAGLEKLINYRSETKASLEIAVKEYSDINKKISDYTDKGLVDAENCPYCGSQLQDVGNYISHLSAKLPSLISKIEESRSTVAGLDLSITGGQQAKQAYTSWKNSKDGLEAGLAPLEDVTFDQGDYDIYSAVVTQYAELQQEKEKHSSQVDSLGRDSLALQLKLTGLPTYDFAKVSLEVEAEDIDFKIGELKTKQEQKNKFQLDLSMNQQLLQLKKEELEKNKGIKEQNNRRNKYVTVLNDIYEMLHTSEFPRKLIQTYASTVSEYLVDNLRQFNFPYRAEVNDNFGIDVFDTSGRKLPSVSGGQEIMIGVALRLALHSMFGEAFPMMIFDEGSVHLSQESKKSYFEVIKNMKNLSKFKQVIIIDHDEDLAGVVDNTIKL
jgi:DNA repair exonuclease SbcCD ATPase subunit